VQDPLAGQILSGRIRDDDTVPITVGGGNLAINGEAVKEAA
jgi:ATP-dependent Clp protease ATP-binding subunit ClpB